jgi:hypothetical protein
VSDPAASAGHAPAAPRTPTAPAAGVRRFWASRRAAILVAAVAVAAALLDLGRLHRLEQGDSLVPVLVSLQRWTPFYWDQERYGMLVPLLALPFRDPLLNLLVQRFLLGAAGLGAVVLLARHVLAGRDWPLAGTLAAGTLLAAAPEAWLFEYLWNQPYGASLALALAGLAVAEPREGRPSRARLAGGLLLVVAAHWVNAATGVLLLALAAGRAAADSLERGDARRSRARLVRDGALLAIGLGVGQVLLRLYPALTGRPLLLHVEPLAAAALPGAWAALLANGWVAAETWRAVPSAAAAAGIALLALPSLRPHLAGALLRAGALVAAALAYALFAGSLRWVEENAFHWRYLAPSAVLVHLAALSLLAEPLARLRRTARPVGVAALALLPAAAIAAGGLPSLAGVRADLDRAAGRLTADVLAARCDVVAGDYWSVWPAVFHATLVLRERGEARPVWGVTHRTNATVEQWWSRRASLRICRPRGEEAQAERWLRSFHLWPVREVERRETVDVLVWRDPDRE